MSLQRCCSIGRHETFYSPCLAIVGDLPPPQEIVLALISQKPGNKEEEGPSSPEMNDPEPQGFLAGVKQLVGRNNRKIQARKSTPIPVMSRKARTCSKCFKELKSEKEHKSHVDRNACGRESRGVSRSPVVRCQHKAFKNDTGGSNKNRTSPRSTN